MATYGIGASIANAGKRPVGTPLVEQGLGQQKEAIGMLTTAAGEEARRNAQNTMLEAEAKQGNQMLGSTLGGIAGGAAAGAAYGSAAGPWGTVIGGALGALAGSLFG
jgi:hypothetical protein